MKTAVLFAMLLLPALLAGCGQRTSAMPLNIYLAQLKSEGYKVEQEVVCPPWRAVMLQDMRMGPDNTPPPIPCRLLLAVDRGGRDTMLREWNVETEPAGEGDLTYCHFRDPGFCDAFGTDAPVFCFTRSTGGNAWGGTNLRLFEMRPEGPHDITPTLPATWTAAGIDDVDNDGIAELIVGVNDYELYAWCCHAASPSVERIFRWDRETADFVDRSAKFKAYYEGEIASLRKNLDDTAPEGDDEAGYYTGMAVSCLLNHWCIGRTEDGWKAFSRDMDRLTKTASANRRAEIAAMKADLRKRLGLPPEKTAKDAR